MKNAQLREVQITNNVFLVDETGTLLAAVFIHPDRLSSICYVTGQDTIFVRDLEHEAVAGKAVFMRVPNAVIAELVLI